MGTKGQKLWAFRKIRELLFFGMTPTILKSFHQWGEEGILCGALNILGYGFPQDVTEETILKFFSEAFE